MRLKSTLGFLSFLLVSACALVEPVYVYVDGIAAPSAEPQETYFLFSGRRGLHHEDLQFRRYAVHADEALQAAGYRKVTTPDEADIVVGFSYGVEVERVGALERRTSHIELAAFDWDEVRDDGDRNAIWRTQAYMDGSHGGLGRVVPMLVEASTPWLGKSTGGIVEVEFD
jgi:hypothetical protein